MQTPAHPIFVAVTAMHDELCEVQAAHRAELGALREMLTEQRPAEGDNLDAGTSERMRCAVSNILRLQRVIAQLGQ
jgi:hypothetical protein